MHRDLKTRFVSTLCLFKLFHNTFQTFYGQILLFDGKDATVEKIKHGQPMVYKIRFPIQNPLPTITEITVNSEVVCEGTEISGSVTKVSLQHTLQTSQTVINNYQPSYQEPGNYYPSIDYDYETKRPTTTESFQESLPIFWQYLNNRTAITTANTTRKTTTTTTKTTRKATTTTARTTRKTTRPTTTTRITTTSTTTPKAFKNDPYDKVLQVCGQAALSYRPLILGGRPIERGYWPWLVAIYINDPKSLSFNCAGNLVSTRTVLTAAHCLKFRGIEHKAEHLLIVVGRYNLLDWSESSSTTTGVERVMIHPDYDSSLSSFDGDLAIIIVQKTIT